MRKTKNLSAKTKKAKEKAAPGTKPGRGDYDSEVTQGAGHQAAVLVANMKNL